MKEGMAMVVWVPDPNRYGCYTSTGVEEDGGLFISDELPENEAIMAEQLNREAEGASGGYIVISEW